MELTFKQICVLDNAIFYNTREYLGENLYKSLYYKIWKDILRNDFVISQRMVDALSDENFHSFIGVLKELGYIDEKGKVIKK